MTTQYILKNDDGTFYYKDREMRVFHREDGPAAEWAYGSKYWYIDGLLHREDGPAIERSSGSREWCLYGKLHREDGPARIYSSGKKEWYLQGGEVTEEQHKRLTTKEPTILIEGKAFTVAQLKNLIEKATI